MKYILDTDTIIYYLKGYEPVVSRFIRIPLHDMGTTIINYSELLYGAYKSTHPEKNLHKIEDFLKNIPLLTFCEKASHLYAKSKAKLKIEGNIVADLDLMIASICLKHQLILVTNNLKHFARIKHLKVENWLIY